MKKRRSSGLDDDGRIFAHGAIHPVLFTKNERANQWDNYRLVFGASVDDTEYPVHFYGLDNIKELHKWLGDKIKDAKDSGE